MTLPSEMSIRNLWGAGMPLLIAASSPASIVVVVAAGCWLPKRFVRRGGQLPSSSVEKFSSTFIADPLWRREEERLEGVKSVVVAAAATMGKGGGEVAKAALAAEVGPEVCTPVGTRALSAPQEWIGLPTWRTNPLNELRVWRKHGPRSSTNSADEFEEIASVAPTASTVFKLHLEKLHRLEREIETHSRTKDVSSLAEWGALVLGTADPVEKAVFTHYAYRLWSNGHIPLGVAEAPESPARPNKPELVHPRNIPPPKDTSLTPSAHSLHNLAHIELNAIDLAWDTVVRFSGASDELDQQFFADFAHVADDESRHCLWCLQRLAELGFSYGDMPAHNLLLRDCQRSSGSVMARLAVIPMMQEARGLDAGPRLVDRLTGNGDTRSAGIAKQIAEEEVAHVGVGVAWFLRVCRQISVDPAVRFQDLLKETEVELRGPFNHSARLTAGLPRDWYDLSFDPSAVVINNHVTTNGQRPKVVRKSRERAMQVTKQQVSIPTHSCQGGESNLATSSTSRLPEVFERLAMVVAMEQDNANA